MLTLAVSLLVGALAVPAAGRGRLRRTRAWPRPVRGQPVAGASTGDASWRGQLAGFLPRSARPRCPPHPRPLIEAEHLPLSVKVTFTGTAGRTSLDGGRIPSAGTVTVTLSNATSQPADLPTAADASATEQHRLQQQDVLVDQVGFDELRRKGRASPDLEAAALGGPQLADRTDRVVGGQQRGVLPGQIGRPIVSGSKYGCDQPPCAKPPSKSSSAPPRSRSEQ